MSRFADPYLAESAGYNSGHARGLEAGIDMGLESGYTRGWNEATVIGNAAVAERDAAIDKLHSVNERLAAENAQLRQHIQLQQEQAHALRADYEGMRMAFLGAVSVAFTAMKAVAKLPLQERVDVFFQYGRKAFELQSKEYILANRFPHEQPLVQKYLPIANQVFTQTYAQMRQLESEQNAEAAA
ncbi:MAG: hypothetical protein KBF33_16125 [Comamonas sp.]|jgi:hypothetical protein|nr:hypothetical protein [Comamonas sp.]